MRTIFFYIALQIAVCGQSEAQAINKKTAPTPSSKPMTYAEKELFNLYKPIKYEKFVGEVPRPVGAIWPANVSENGDRFEHTIADGTGFMSNLVTIKGTPKTEKQIIHYYKIDAQLNATHYLSFEGLRYEDGVPGELGPMTYISKSGQIYMFKVNRNGILLYKIKPDGSRTTLAGNSTNYKKLKDGYGREASITNAAFLNETVDGNIIFIEKIYSDYIHEDFPNLPFNDLGYCYLWRMITPDGEIKTITNKQGVPINQYVYSNVLIDQSGNWYFSIDDEIVKTKPHVNNTEVEIIAGSRSFQELRYIGKQKGSLSGTWYQLGEAKKALIPNITHLAWGPSDEIFLFSSAALRIVKYKDGLITHFSGTSDTKSWFAGTSLGANCHPDGEKDGSAFTAHICNMKSMKWVNNQLVLLKKEMLPDPNNPGYYLPSFKISKIDKTGNVKTVSIGQNLNPN